MEDDTYTQHVPAREIPLPGSVSPEARAMLARGTMGAAMEWPALDDTPAWLAMIEMMNQGALAIYAQMAAAGSKAFGYDPEAADEVALGDAIAYVATPEGVADDDPRVVLHIHGGAWIQGGGILCRAGTPSRAAGFGVRTYSVDYRMPPEHPFPAAIDDVVAAYRALLADQDASQIVVARDSAGANIAAGLMQRLRDEGRTLPAGLVLDSPATDLTGGSDSLYANDGVDTVLTGDFRQTMALYAGSTDARHPHISPVFGDLAAGYPPTLLLTGTRDRLLSDTVRLHRALRAARQEVELHVFEAHGHGGFMGTAPEDRERAGVIREFVARRFGG